MAQKAEGIIFYDIKLINIVTFIICVELIYVLLTFIERLRTVSLQLTSKI